MIVSFIKIKRSCETIEWIKGETRENKCWFLWTKLNEKFWE